MPNDHRTNADLPAGRLSQEEAAELAAQVAELTRSGLPLADGLQALADELPGGRLRRALRAMGQQLQQGVPLDAAIQAQQNRLPQHLRGLILAGLRGGRLPEVLEEFVDIRRDQVELRRRVALSLAYPTLLLLLLVGLFVFLKLVIAGAFVRVFLEFQVDLPLLTKMFIHWAGTGTWISLGLALLLVAAVFLLPRISGPSWVLRLLYLIPLLGPLWRWGRLVQCSRLMALLLEQQVPLPEALRLTAAGLPDAFLAGGCRRAARQVEAGRSITESLATLPQFPPSMIPLVNWGQRSSALADSFRAAAEMFAGRLQSQGLFLEAILLPVMFVVIAAFVLTFIVAMFLPLISLLTCLC